MRDHHCYLCNEYDHSIRLAKKIGNYEKAQQLQDEWDDHCREKHPTIELVAERDNGLFPGKRIMVRG